jgi:hypothetical protein
MPPSDHQEGIYRTKEETKESTIVQIFTALQPAVTATLADAVRTTGTKDALAQPVIDSLVKLGQQLRKGEPGHVVHTPNEVQSILTEELEKVQSLGNGIINPLIDMDGM